MDYYSLIRNQIYDICSNLNESKFTELIVKLNAAEKCRNDALKYYNNYLEHFEQMIEENRVNNRDNNWLPSV